MQVVFILKKIISDSLVQKKNPAKTHFLGHFWVYFVIFYHEDGKISHSSIDF